MGDGKEDRARSGADAGPLKHAPLLVAVAPVVFAAVRLLGYSRGDPALLGVLAQTLDVPAIVVASLLPFASFVVLTVTYALLADPEFRGRTARRLNEWIGPRLLWIGPLAFLVVLLLPWLSVVFVAALVGAAVMVGRLRRRHARRRGKEAKPLRWVEDGPAFIGLILVFYLTVTAGMWLPAEEIHLTSGATEVVHVLSEGDGWTTLLDAETRQVSRVHTAAVSSRSVCELASSRSLVAIFAGQAPQPACSP